jgi:hypothetical protein
MKVLISHKAKEVSSIWPLRAFIPTKKKAAGACKAGIREETYE